MTETLENRIKRHEGFCHVPKYDAKGMWVIGYGHDITEQEAHDYANGITEDQAEALLETDIAKAKAEIAKEMPWTCDLSSEKQDILIEMAFQLGIHGLYGFNNMLYCARKGDDDGVAREMLDSLWHKQTPDRCEELANLWLNNPVA